MEIIRRSRIPLAHSAQMFIAVVSLVEMIRWHFTLEEHIMDYNELRRIRAGISDIIAERRQSTSLERYGGVVRQPT